MASKCIVWINGVTILDCNVKFRLDGKVCHLSDQPLLVQLVSGVQLCMADVNGPSDGNFLQYCNKQCAFALYLRLSTN